MTKSRDSLMRGPWRRNTRAQKLWKVDIHSRGASEARSASTRSRISSAALFVKVTASTSSGVT